MDKKKKGIILLIMALGLIGCTTNTTSKKAIEESKIAIASGEYEKAFNLLSLAKEEGNITEEFENHYKVLNVYNEAVNLMNNFEFEKVIDKVSTVENIETYDNLEEDIEKLKNNAQSSNNLINAINNELKAVRKLVEIGELGKTKDMLDSIENLEEIPVILLDEIKFIGEMIALEENNIKEENERVKLEEKQKEEEKKQNTIEKGMKIIEEDGDHNIRFEKIVNESDFSIKELRSKDLYLFFNLEENSPNEYYYEPISGDMYRLEQGMYFVINDDYRVATPKESNMYETSFQFRHSYLDGKIDFTLEDAEKVVAENEAKFGLEGSYVSDGYGLTEFVDGIKLYHVEAIFTADKTGVFTYLVGSDGKLYQSLLGDDKELKELT